MSSISSCGAAWARRLSTPGLRVPHNLDPDMPVDPAPVPEFSRPVPLTRITSAALFVDIAARPAECAAVAKRLELPGLQALDAHWELNRRPGGAIEAEAVLRARLTRECVVTLEPFEGEVEERFSVRFIPESASGGGDDDLLDPQTIDELPYRDDRIDLGEATVEQLALGLDPFPRKPGAALPEGASNDGEAADPAEAAVHPFAALRSRSSPR